MDQEALHFGENSIMKNAFHKNKKPININEVDIKRITLSNKKSYGNQDSFKCFTGFRHKGNAFPAPLCIKFLKWTDVLNILIKVINTWIF